MKTAKRIEKARRRNKELNVKSSSAKLHTKEVEERGTQRDRKNRSSLQKHFLASQTK